MRVNYPEFNAQVDRYGLTNIHEENLEEILYIYVL